MVGVGLGWGAILDFRKSTCTQVVAAKQLNRGGSTPLLPKLRLKNSIIKPSKILLVVVIGGDAIYRSGGPNYGLAGLSAKPELRDGGK